MAGRAVGRVIGVFCLTIALAGPAIAGTKGSKGGAVKSPAAAAADKPAADLATFLIKPAELAIKKRDFALAISLWRGVVAVRGDGDEAVWKLADAWKLAGRFEEAAEDLERYREAVADPAKKTKADDEIEALKARPEAFSSTFRVKPATREATEAFKRGRKFFAQKKYEEAILLFKAGYSMAPDLPGNLRELGQAYEKLGRGDEAIKFYARYLRMRPFGKNADTVRERLQKVGYTARLTVDSAMPCEEIWMNGQPFPLKVPAKDIVVAPGYYKALCWAPKYHLAYYEDVRLQKGESGRLEFAWAVIVNQLDPWARVIVEDSLAPGKMKDIGSFEENGVPVPRDRRALRVVLRAGDGSKQKELLVKLEPGQKVKLEW